MLVLTRQPTIRRANTSITKATYSQPFQVDTYMKSDTLIWAVGMELALHAIQRAERLVAGHRCAQDLAAPYALQSSQTHQSLYRASGTLDAFSPQLLPDLRCAIALHVGVPYTLDFQDQCIIALSTATAQCWVALLSRVLAVTGRGDPQDKADRLDPKTVTMLIERPSGLGAVVELRLGKIRTG